MGDAARRGAGRSVAHADRAGLRAGAVRGVLFGAAIGLIAALWTLTWPGDERLFPPAPDGEGVVVHLLDNGFHTDLAVPRAALLEGGGPLAEATQALAPGDWVLVGWGDAIFYVDQSPISDRLPDGARAFFRPGNASVVMLDPEQDDPALRPEKGRQTLRLSSAGMAALRGRLASSLRLHDDRPVLATMRAGGDARFYESRETFWVGHLCNHWTGELLNAAGLPIRPFRSITSGELMRAARRAGPSPAPIHSERPSSS